MKCPYQKDNNLDYGSFDTLKIFRLMNSLP
jgi:hypothetical protein